MVTRLAALALVLGGCSLLVSVDGLTGGSAPAADGGGIDQTAGPDAAIDARAPDGGACTASFDTDAENCGRCGHSCLGASCSGGRCEPFRVATGQDHPLGIFVAPEGSRNAGYVFWVNQSPHASLRRALKNGQNQVPLDDPSDALQSPVDIVADDNNIYWTESPVNASGVFKKAISAGMKQPYSSVGSGRAGFLAIDGSTLYASSFSAPTGFILSDQNLYSGPYTVGGLAVQANVIYWIQQEPQVIVSGGKQGGNPSDTTMWARTDVKPMGLAVDDGYIYWTENGSRIQRLSKTAGGAETIYTASQPFGDTDLAVDNDSLFWTENQNGLVLRLAKP
jgi:hypothetical protein